MSKQVKTLIYGTTPPRTFTEELKAEIKAGRPVEVETSYGSIHEVPQELKNQFDLDAAVNPSWVDPKTGKFVPGAKVPTKFNMRALIAGGAVVAGAGAGALVGGPVGAGVGAVVGAGVGAIVAVVTQDNVRAHVEIDARGRLSVKVEPVK